MERPSGFILKGLTAVLALGAAFTPSRVNADIGGDVPYRRADKIEDVEKLVGDIKNEKVKGDVLIGLYDSGLIPDGDPAVQQVLEVFETRGRFDDAALLSKRLGDFEHAKMFYSKYLDAKVPEILARSDGSELARVAGAAVEFGLQERSKVLYVEAARLFVREGDFETAADLVLVQGDSRIADELYGEALIRARTTPWIDDDVRLLGKMGRYGEADKLYAEEIAKEEARCDFYHMANLYSARAELANKRGDKAAEGSLREKSDEFYILARVKRDLRFECGEHDSN